MQLNGERRRDTVGFRPAQSAGVRCAESGGEKLHDESPFSVLVGRNDRSHRPGRNMDRVCR